MARRSSPTVLRRQLGALLRQYREALGETSAQVARALDVNPSQISRIETGQRRPGIMYVREMCRHYGLDQPTTEHLIGLARESRQVGWWEQFDLDLPSSTYVSLESAADSISNFENGVVPGLLQTEGYASAIVRSLHPEYSDEELERAAVFRARRKEILAGENPLQFDVVIDEGVLRRPIGGPAVFRDQLREMIRLSELPNVRLQVLPFSVGYNFGLGGGFAVLTFGEALMPDVVYAESPLGMMFQDREEDVSRCREGFASLTDLAADRNESIAIIRDSIQSSS